MEVIISLEWEKNRIGKGLHARERPGNLRDTHRSWSQVYRES